ncbi:PREDICTED: uncharacterized protein LOC105561434 [Vollenhovia emeryi]|uniref:uncharacterized protein LOC105561434 n=1 Tax=Vollenhovia emeryi TaxID=411798 RepID=UPI0005F57964|nr:PREDICTED: uncharacterized protein LOC105561434 [Vollenhovia emeryi]
MYKANKTVFSSNSAHKDSANKVHINKSNNNVDQFSGSKKQKSDNILNEIHTNFEKHANEMKEFQRQVLRHLHSINGRMGELNEHVESLKQPNNFFTDQDNANQNITNEVSLQCIESLPVKSNIELQDIERTLQDKQIFHDVVRLL